eukprot:gene15566-21019_t
MRRTTISMAQKISPPKGIGVVTDGNYGSLVTGGVALAVRLGTGVFVAGWEPVSKSVESNKDGNLWPGTLGLIRDGSSLVGKMKRPSKPIIIYEYEASPYCRKVREACVILDLTVEYRPCPGARSGWSSEMSAKTKGKQTVPFMIDTGATEVTAKNGMFESDAIIEYLFETYGPGKSYIPWTLKGDFATQTCIIAGQVRGFAGSRLLPNSRKDLNRIKPIEFWGYESSPYCKIVRETLSSLGLAHKMINCGRGSANRDVLYKKTGYFQVPFIEDPNTGVSMFESSEIVKYLFDTYTV